MDRPEANRRYVALIAAISAVVLGLGVWLKPKREAPVRPSEQERSRLESLLRKKALEDMAAYFYEATAVVAPHVVRLEKLSRSGLVWDGAGALVTASTRGPFPPSTVLLTSARTRSEGRTAVAGPDLPVALLWASSDPRLRPVRPLGSGSLQPGQWLLAVWRQEDGDHAFAAGLYSETVSAACGEIASREVLSNLHLTPAMLGGGVFNLNGNLAAVIVSCGERLAAMAVDQVASLLKVEDAPTVRLFQRYGIKTAPLEEWSRRRLHAREGLLVTEVWDGYPPASAGLTPGDVVVAVEEDPVRNQQDLENLLSAWCEETCELRLVRRGRTARVQLRRDAPDPAAGDAVRARGIVLASPAPGYVIEAVASGSAAFQAGLRPGDRLIDVNGAPVRGAAHLDGLLARRDEQPAFLVFRRGGKTRGVVLESR